MKKVHLAVYVTADEAAALRRAAKASRQANISEWARDLLLRSIRWKKAEAGKDGLKGAKE